MTRSFGVFSSRWIVLFMIPLGLFGQTVRVGFLGLAENCIPFGCGGAAPNERYQQVYASTAFPGPLAINAISFFNTFSSLPPESNAIRPATYIITLSTTSKAVDGLSTNLDDNVGADSQVFFNGVLGGPFSGTKFTITGNTFLYNPAAGNLLLDVRVVNPGPNSLTFFDIEFNGPFSRADGPSNGVATLDGFGLVTEFQSTAPPTTGSDTAYLIRYAGNLNIGDSFVNLTNAGTLSGIDPAGRICANVYTFDPNEELISCCSCLITPNGLNSLSVRGDLISNTLTPGVPSAVTIKLLASTPVGGTCDAAAPKASTLVRGLRAWGTTNHALATNPVSYSQTETPFAVADLSPSELTKLTSFCSFIKSVGSGFGICASCRNGALGAAQK